DAIAGDKNAAGHRIEQFRKLQVMVPKDGDIGSLKGMTRHQPVPIDFVASVSSESPRRTLFIEFHESGELHPPERPYEQRNARGAAGEKGVGGILVLAAIENFGGCDGPQMGQNLPRP